MEKRTDSIAQDVGQICMMAAMKAARQRAFLSAYRQLGNVTQAARAASVVRATHYVWMQDAAYRDAFEDARAEAADMLEAECWRRGRGRLRLCQALGVYMNRTFRI